MRLFPLGRRYRGVYVDVSDYESRSSADNAADGGGGGGVDDEGDAGVLVDSHFPRLHIAYPRSAILPPVPCMLNNTRLRCPRNAPLVLRQLYGDDWRMRKPEWKPLDTLVARRQAAVNE
jgi:hypothetical protein